MTQSQLQILNAHKVKGAANSLQVIVMDEPGSGGGHHHYAIMGFDTSTNKSDIHPKLNLEYVNIFFQNGCVTGEDSLDGVPQTVNNGLTIETLLAVCAHRLLCFQDGPFACESNAKALTGITDALEALTVRTKERIARNVEGKEFK